MSTLIEQATALGLAEALRINAADDLEGERIGDESPEAFVVRKILEASGLPDQLRGAVEAAEQAVALAERYGEAIIAISSALPNVNRVRLIIASLDTGGQS